MKEPLSVVLFRFHRVLAIASQVVLVALAYGTAFALRFDGAPPNWAWSVFWQTLPWLVAVRALTFGPLKLYEGLWRYTSLRDIRDLAIGIGLSSVLFFLLNLLVLHAGVPRSVYVIDALLLACLLGGVRLARRAVAEIGHAQPGKRVLVYGAGDAGELLVRDMLTHRDRGFQPIGFVDDDRKKVGLRMHGIPVLGTHDDLPRIVEETRPDEVVLAIPQASPAALRQIVRRLDRFSVPIKTLPALHELLDGRVEVTNVRSLSMSDLLSRGSIDLDRQPVRRFLSGRRVLVTGAGGSIGSELCRQIARTRVARLVLLDHAENGLFHIANELADRGYGDVLSSVIADITDAARIEQVMREYQPEVVFHAAAHKHVPLMEWNPCEAVKNNVTGTRTLAAAAERAGVDRFVLISTDKAVNPTSVMGATKRVAELLLQTQSEGSGTTFLTVRFGNVLASAGSVVPRFLDQIKAGGPVTVTHPEIRRFFMLIPEAVQLVLHAAAGGETGRLYVLEMGDQIKLVDLARDLIRLAGYVPETEIPISFIGLRPGEKLFEELFGADEVAAASPMKDILAARPLTLPSREALAEEVVRLEQLAAAGDVKAVLAQLGVIVPAYRDTEAPPAEVAVPASASLQAVAEYAPEQARWQEEREPCPTCGSADVYRSHTRSRVEDLRRKLTSRRPYRCHGCGWRGWLPDHGHAAAAGFAPTAREVIGTAPDLKALDDVISAGSAPVRRPFAPRDVEA